MFQNLMRETHKRSYSPFKCLKTYFVGELKLGKDTGGLARELWSIFSKSIQPSFIIHDTSLDEANNRFQ